MTIGDWVQRERRGKAHKVESIVAGDIITSCGRRMTDEPTKTGGRLVPVIDQLCRVCEDEQDHRVIAEAQERYTDADWETLTPL